VRIRTFKKVGKKVYYSTWSEAKTVRTKAGKAKNGSTVQNLEITMSTGEELDLNLMLPYDISDYGQTWESSDEEIATVDGKGIATALQPGTVVITMTNGDDEQVVFTVTVSEMEISLGEEEPILLADDILPGDDAELPLEIELEIPMAE
jgi:flagellar basal body P-ring protein FlgI